MSIGIYKINFQNTDSVYIGQSVDIERRISTHSRELQDGSSSEKLNKAYKQYGMPSFEILEICELEYLDEFEKAYILQYDSIEHGFNTTPGGFSNFGANASAAKYKKETYIEILNLLVNTHLDSKEIAQALNVSEVVVKHISDLSRHSWLVEESPDLYTKLMELRSSGRKSCALAKGIVYPPIVSPEGVEYIVENTRKFSEKHSLPNGALCAVLNGKQKYIYGWRLKNTPPVPKPTKVISPKGVIYEIPYRGTPLFCKEHNLCKSCVRELIKGKAGHHKGWTVVKPQ